MPSPETGSSFCVKQTLGAPDRPSIPPRRHPPSRTVCQQLPFPGVGGGSAWPEQGGGGRGQALRVTAVPPLQESRWVSDGLCLVSLEGGVGSNKAGIRDVSVCGAHATCGGWRRAPSAENKPHPRPPASGFLCPLCWPRPDVPTPNPVLTPRSQVGP